MNLSLNWLKDFVDIPKTMAPEELGRLLCLHTVEVEKVERLADKYKKVVVGKILEIKSHPGADRLSLVKVDIGPAELEIVCGASNIKTGQLVPVALVGAVLPNGLEIKPAEIRGVKSNGMLCAEDELGLGQDHSGIIILTKGKVGQAFSDYLNLNDVVLEVDNKSITHRADLWSHYGMARDISAFLNVKFKDYRPKVEILKTKNVKFKIKAKVEDFKLCPRYLAVGLENIKIQASPEWLATRLSACGLRPINNIVDATNYVMLELGQPLHAFDKNFIDSIVIRRAKAGEIIETLDKEKRKLDADMLVIADKAKPVAIAGVMGGANSEINNTTSSIIIEAANFNYDSIRKTAQKLGLRTEASMRFEKGLDPNLAELALARVVELIMEICPGAKVASNLVDEKKFKLNQGPIILDLDWLNGLTGENFKLEQVKQILDKLGFAVKITNSRLNLTIPTWRASRDISRAEDIAEEVARIYGYNNIKASLPKIDLTPPREDGARILIRQIKNILSLGAGLSEVYNYSFIGASELNKLKMDLTEAVKLANPLSEDLALLRPSLVPLLLENIKTNQAKEETIALYEIGSIFLNKSGDISKDGRSRDNLFWQEKHLTIVLAGGETDNLFLRLKGVISYLLTSLSLEVGFQETKTPAAWAAPLIAAEIVAAGRVIGRVAEVEKNIARSFGLKKRVVMAEIYLTKLKELTEKQAVKQFKEPPKYPEVLRDLAFVVNDKILYNNIRKQIINFSDLIKQVDLFDVYQGEKIDPGKKSLAWHIIYQADKTLTSEEVDQVQEKLVKHLEKELGAKMRDF